MEALRGENRPGFRRRYRTSIEKAALIGRLSFLHCDSSGAVVILAGEFWILGWLVHGTGLAALLADPLWGKARVACVVQVRCVGVGMSFVVAGYGVYVIGLDCFAECFAVFQTLLFYWDCHGLFLFERDARLFYLVAGGCG